MALVVVLGRPSLYFYLAPTLSQNIADSIAFDLCGKAVRIAFLAVRRYGFVEVPAFPVRADIRPCGVSGNAVPVNELSNEFGDASAQLSSCMKFDRNSTQLVDQLALVMIFHRLVARGTGKSDFVADQRALRKKFKIIEADAPGLSRRFSVVRRVVLQVMHLAPCTQVFRIAVFWLVVQMRDGQHDSYRVF